MNLIQQPSAWIFLVGFVIYVGIRARFESKVEAEAKTVEDRKDGVEKALLGLVLIGSLLIPVLYLLTPLFAFADREQSLALLSGGAVLMALALWLFYRAHADLGVNWSASLEIREEHKLVDQGVYQRVRHPMYAAIFLFSISQGLLLPNWVAGLSAFVSFLPLYLVRVPREEAMMRETFGVAYEDYCGRTGRIVPGVGWI